MSTPAGFFDRYPAFFETSETSASRWRLNLRHEAIFAEYAEVFPGMRVLDLASHDGRWSMAALHAGARQVTGVEARSELVTLAEQTLASYGADPAGYRFLSGDLFQALRRDTVQADVVLCLGFAYHTLRYPELFSLIRDSGARHLVVDTEVRPGASASIEVRWEPTSRQGNAVPDEFAAGDKVIVGRPTLRALRRMLRGYGFDLERLSDWESLLRRFPQADGVGDYRGGRRLTALFSRPVG